MAGNDVAAPGELEKLRSEIVKSYDDLSPRLQQVAKYVLENPNDMALQTLAVIAERCHVQPSTIVIECCTTAPLTNRSRRPVGVVPGAIEYSPARMRASAPV